MSGLFGGGSSSQAQQEIYAGIQVSTSLYGNCIPYIAGRQRIPFNLLWFGNFTVGTSNSGGGKGGGGNSNKQYNYSAAFIAGLCIGPIQGITQVWHDKALVTLSYENLALGEGGASFVGSISGTTLTVTKMNGGFVAVGATLANSGVLSGTTITANGSGSGGVGTYTVNHSQTVASGSPMRSTQLAWSGYPSGTPTVQKITYDNQAYVASSSYNLGSSAALPNLGFEVEGVVPGYSDANSIYDADPSAVIPDYLLEPVHGALAGYPGTPLVIGSSAAPLTGTSNSYQAYVMSLGLLTSPLEDTQRQATDFISELLQCTNSDCRLSVGTLEIIPYADQAVSATVAGTSFSYTPNLTPEYQFTDDDYSPQKDDPPVKLSRTPQSDTYNMVSVEYLDRSNYYNTAPVTCSDQSDIALYGPRLASSLSWHQITQSNVALQAGQLWLQRQLYERNSYTFRVRADYSLLEPMDYIALNDTNLGLVGQVCQITQIDDDADNVLTITATELPGVIRTVAQYNWNAAAGYFANYAADPGVVQTPAIFVMPPIPAALSEGITIGLAACGQTSNGVWLGCDVYCSLDGGTTYEPVGTMPEACRYGALTANLAAVADPDTTSTLSIALANTNLQISTAVTHAEADSVQTMVLVDTGTQAEVMSFGAAALASAGHYNLSYLRRGLYGSLDQAHTTSDLFVRLDGAIFQIALDPGYAGQTVYFKFVSFNLYKQYGNQTLASSTAYPYTIPSALPVSGTNALIPQGTCAVNGTSVYKQPNGVVAWDSDAYSPQAYLNGCFISWRSASSVSADSIMTGFSTNPTASLSFTSLNFAIYQNGGAVGIYESSVSIGTFGTYAVGDSFEVRYDGVTIRYFQNGALLRAVRASGFTLYPKTCLGNPNNIISNVEFGSASAVNQPTGSWLNTYPWVVGSTGTQGNYTDSQASGTPGSIVLGNGTGTSPYGPYGTPEALWTGPGGSAANQYDVGWRNSGDLYGIDPSKTYRACVWFRWHGTPSGGKAFFGPIDDGVSTCNVGTQTVNVNPYFVNGIALTSLSPDKWYLLVGFVHGSGYTGGSCGQAGIYDPVTGTLVSTGTDFNQTAGVTRQEHRIITYNSTAGSSLQSWWTKPRYEEVNGNEPSLQALLAPAAALQGFVATGNCVVTGQTFAKQGGSVAWDSCVYSVNGYTTAHISAKPNTTGDSAMIGFATDPSLSSSYTNGNYEWYNTAGTWNIFESGTGVGGSHGTVATGDLPEITYDGSTITYLLNKVVIRTVSVSGLTLYAFVPIEASGSGWNSVNFGPTPSLAVIDTSVVSDNAMSQIISNTISGNTPYTLTSAVSADVITATVVATGAPMGIDVTWTQGAVHNPGGSGGLFVSPMTATVTRDGTAIGVASVDIYDWIQSSTPVGSPIVDWSTQMTLTVSDAPSAGSHTYALHLNAASTGGTASFLSMGNVVIKVREYKK